MKKCKLFLLILTAALLILPGKNVEAAEQEPASVLSLASGTKTTTAEIVVNDMQSLEAKLKISSEKGGVCTLKSLQASNEDGALCIVSGEKIFMVGSGDTVTTTITVELEFAGDDTYTLNLVGGGTDKDGKYNNTVSGFPSLKIVIGEGTDEETSGGDQSSGTGSTDDNDGEDDGPGDNGSEDNQSPEQNQPPAENEALQDSGKKEEVDYSALEQVLSDANQAISSDDSLKAAQDLINKTNEGTVLLGSEDQEQVDKVVQDIQQSLAEIELNKDTGPETTSEKGENNFLWKIILLVLIGFFIAFNIICFMLWRKAKNKVRNYNGAPMVDYDINEDDDL